MRRRRDSNSRGLRPPGYQSDAFDHSATPPTFRYGEDTSATRGPLVEFERVSIRRPTLRSRKAPRGSLRGLSIFRRVCQFSNLGNQGIDRSSSSRLRKHTRLSMLMPPPRRQPSRHDILRPIRCIVGPRMQRSRLCRIDHLRRWSSPPRFRRCQLLAYRGSRLRHSHS